MGQISVKANLEQVARTQLQEAESDSSSLRSLVPWTPSKELSLPTDLIQGLYPPNPPKQKSRTIRVYFTVITIKYRQYATNRMIAFY